jgi:nucleoside-diphosphate-sugar epimerase
MRKLSRSKVLITGAGGFIGSHLCELCLAEGAEVRGFVHYNSRTYGPRQSPRAVIPAIILQAMHSCIVHLGSLDTRRDLTFVKDTARGFIAAACASKIEGETIQLEAQQEYSIAELVGLIGAILNKRLKVISDIKRLRPKGSEVERLYASNLYAKKLLNWQPNVTLQDGLERTVRWFSQRMNRYARNAIYHI